MGRRSVRAEHAGPYFVSTAGRAKALPRRLLWILTSAIALALLNSGTASAARIYHSSILTDNCVQFPINGDVQNKLKFKGKVWADFANNIDTLEIKSKLQRRSTSTAAWTLVTNWPVSTLTFTPTNSSKSLTLIRTYTWLSSADPYPAQYRIVFNVAAIDSTWATNPTQYSAQLHSAACP